MPRFALTVIRQTRRRCAPFGDWVSASSGRRAVSEQCAVYPRLLQRSHED
uniref:Trp53 induced glycolysis regulatory phosphatase n=1 Tax=Mus musculus TaxID=10090 RepID=A0A0J9YV11_MOUSE